MPMDPEWLRRAKRLQALAQSGLAFTRDAYDRERYEAIRAIAAEMIAAGVAQAAASAAAEAGGVADRGVAAEPGGVVESGAFVESGAVVDRDIGRDRGTDASTAPGSRAGDPVRALEEIFAAQSGYATPKVDVRAAVFRGDRILLVRERSDGGWTLPGGWADVGESPGRAVERETLEESGCAVRAVKLAAVYDRNLHGHTPHLFHIWKLFFLCEPVGGAGRAGRERAAQGADASSNETDAADFFALDALPPLSLGRITAAQIAHMFEHHRCPERPTTFD